MEASKSATTKEVIVYGPKLGKHIIKNLKAKGFKVLLRNKNLLIILEDYKYGIVYSDC